jgi:hypothetical protein
MDTVIPPTTTAAVRVTTSRRERSIVPRWSWFATLQATLAALIFALGIPATIAAVDDLGFYSRVDPSGSQAGHLETEDTLAQLELENPRTAGQERDLAFALLSHGNDRGLAEAAQAHVVKQAVRGFREYLAKVPADGRAWAGLAAAQIRLGDLGLGADALRMSILTAPWSNTLVQWRCGMAIDVFRVLDAENRELMKGQFRVAAQRSASALAQTVVHRNGARIARLFLASSPDELIKFEAALAHTR